MYMADNEIERKNKQVIEMLHRAGENGMTKTQFTHRTLFWEKYQRDAFIEAMLDAGIIQRKEIDTSRKKSTVLVHYEYSGQ